MALRKPLVIVSGQVEQLQAGDTLDAPQTGGDVVVQTNDEAGPLVPGAPVYNDAADGVKNGKADAVGTSQIIGLALTAIPAAASGSIQTSGPMTLTTAQWDAITGLVGGLTFGVRYYLDPASAGMLTPTAPTTVGQLVVEVGIAVSTTDMLVAPRTPILL